MLLLVALLLPLTLPLQEERTETRADGSVATYQVQVEDGREVLHGEWTVHGASGAVLEKGTYEDGQRVKRWRFYHPNGEKKEIGSYRHGLRDGAWDEYHPNGQKKASGDYEDGLRVGRWRAWFEDGERDEELTGTYRVLRARYPDGTLSYEGSLLDGRPQGPWTYSWPGGETLLEARYFRGRRVGIWSFLHPDGTPDPGFLSGDYDGHGRRPLAGPLPTAVGPGDPGALPPVPEAGGEGTADLARDVEQVAALPALDTVPQRERLAARRREAFAETLERLRKEPLDEPFGRERAVRLVRLLEFLLGRRSLVPEDADSLLALRCATFRAYALWLLTRGSVAFWEILVPSARPVERGPRDEELAQASVPTDELGLPAAPPPYLARFAEREADRAVRDALAWLVAHQGPDGAWSAQRFGERCPDPERDRCDGLGLEHRDTGLTGLALLALLADGNTPFRGPYRREVARAVAWLIAHLDFATGTWPGWDNSWVYQQALATQALAEVQVLAPMPDVARALERALMACHTARNPDAAWRYGWKPDGDNDTSVTCWMLMALARGRDAGFGIGDEVVDEALAWLSSATSEEDARIGYERAGTVSARTVTNDDFPRETAEAMTAAGLTVRLLLRGDRESDLTRRQVALILSKPPSWDERVSARDMYAWYWSSLACELAGGEAARTWHGAFRDVLAESQRSRGHVEGSWDPVGPWGYEGGRVYATAISALALLTPVRFGASERD